MDNDKLNNETDDLFRKGLENLSETDASDQEWLKMKSRMEKEGLLKGRTKGRRFLILLLLAVIGFIMGSLYFFNESSLLDKNTSVKTNNAEIIKKEISGDNHQLTKAFPKSIDTNGEIEKGITKEINNEDRRNTSIKERATELEIGKKSTASAGNLAAGKSEKKVHDKVSDKGIRAKNKLDSSLSKGNKTLTVSESSNVSIRDKGSLGNGISQLSNDSVGATGSEGKENQIDTIKNKAISGDKVSDADSMNNKIAVEHQDSSKVTNDNNLVVAKKKTSEKRKFFIGGYFSLDFNHYLLKENSTVPSEQANYVYDSDSIKGINSGAQFTVGIMLGYMVNDHFEIDGGVSYSKKEAVRTNVTTPEQTADSGQQTYSEYIYDYNAQYLELSGKVKYYYPLGNRKWLYAGVGGIFSFNFPENSNNLGYYTHITYSDSVWVRSDKVILQPASATFSALVVAGFETELNNKWRLFIEPEYKYGFNPVIKHPTFDYIPVNHYWRTFSIGFGLKYNL